MNLFQMNDTVDIETPNYANLVYNAIYYAFNNIVIAAAINNTGVPNLNLLSYGPGPVLVSALRDYIEGDAPLDTSAVIATLQSMFQNITLSSLSALRSASPMNRPVSSAQPPGVPSIFTSTSL